MKRFLCTGACWLQATLCSVFAAFDSQTTIPAPPGSDFSFGSPVALSGNTLLAAAPDEEVNGVIAGAVYVFVNTNGTWVQQARLVAPQPLDFEFFGSAVALSGDTAVVGSYGDPFTQRGAAYVFSRTGENWAMQQSLAASDAADSQLFGTSVAVSGGTVAVGAFSDASRTARYAGAAYVFVRNGSQWIQQQKVTAATPVAGELLGYSVALEGDTLVAGAPYADGFAGAAYVFVRGGTAWSQVARLAAGTSGGQMGSSIALNGATVIAGAPEDDHNGILQRAGAAHIFSFDGVAWNHTRVIAGNPFVRRDFGMAVAVNGDTAIVGSSGELDDYDQFTAREAYVFTRSGAAWAQSRVLTPVVSDSFQHFFGFSVAMDGSRAVIGDFGSAFVFGSPQNVAPSLACTTPLQTFTCVAGLVPVSATAAVSDEDNDALIVVWSVDGVPFETVQLAAGTTKGGIQLTSGPVSLGAGTHQFTVSVSDGKEAANCSSSAVLIPDTTPPTIVSLTATPNVLSPPNGKMVPVQVAVSASDDCSATQSRIVDVVVTDSGSGNNGKKSKPTTGANWEITSPLSVKLQADRPNGKSTRTYTILVETSDASGNVSKSSVTVTVP